MPIPPQSNGFYTIRALAADGEDAEDDDIAVTAPDGTVAEVLIYGPIGDGCLFEESVEAADFVQDIAKVTADRLQVRINSEGGSVPSGITIYNALRRHPAKVDVFIDGMALSIASMIAMAGDTITMADNAMMMVHAPHSLIVGNARDMRQSADLLDTWANQMAKAFVRVAGDSHAADINAIHTDGEDHWYTAVEAKAAGFITAISDGVKIAARYDFRHIHNVPAAAAAYSKKEPPMAKPNENGRTDARSTDTQHQPPAPHQPAAQPEASAPAPEARGPSMADIKAAETTRKQAIRAAFKPFAGYQGVPDLQDECIDDMDITADAARTRLLAKIGQGAEPLGTAQNQGAFEHGADEIDKRRQAKSESILARVGGIKDDQGKPIALDTANPYRGMKLAELAKASLKEVGVDVSGQNPEEFAGKALARHVMAAGGQSTSDFPVILEDVMHKILLNGWNATPITWSRFCRTGNVSDFREWHRLVPGLIGGFDRKNEAGEYVAKNIPDAEMQTIRAEEYGSIITIDRRVLVNDDIGYIQQMASGLGMAASRGVESSVYKLLASNPVMRDGNPLFDAAHNNLDDTGAVPGVDALAKAANTMAAQRAPGDDNEFLDIQPAVSVSNKSVAMDMQVIVFSQYDPDASNKLQRPNKVRGVVGDIVGSPRVTGPEWYLFAESSVAPVVEVVFLNGASTPRLLQTEDFATGSLKWRPTLDYGVGAIDWRGAWKNPGV